MLAVPGPSGFDDRPQVSKFRFPTEYALRGAGIRDQRGRVAFAAADFARVNRMAGDSATDVNDFFHARTMPRAEVEFQLHPRLQLLERRKVRGCKVVDMDVVTNARAVGRRIVGAEDINVFA